VARSDWATLGSIALGALVVGGGAVYLATRPRATASETSTPTYPYGQVPGSGPRGSTPSGSTTSGSTPSGSTTSGSAPGPSGGTPAGGTTLHANASGGTVTLSAPASVPAGSTVTLTATSSGVASPEYQFWWLPPGANPATGWQQSGAYAAAPQYAVTATTSGTLTAIAYARSTSAPRGESAAERPTYEAASNLVTIAVT
jgi:hypothetical protein